MTRENMQNVKKYINIQNKRYTKKTRNSRNNTHRGFNFTTTKLCIIKKISVVHCGNVIIIKYFRYHVSQCSHLGCELQHFHCIRLGFIRQWGRLVMQNLLKHYTLLWLAGFQQLQQSIVEVFLYTCTHK